MGDCRRSDVPCLVQLFTLFTFPLGTDASAAFARRKPGLVLEAPAQVRASDIGLLCVELPGDARGRDERPLLAACREPYAVLTSPCVVASAGVPFDECCSQVRIAFAAGASGVLAGRAVWKEAIPMSHRPERRHRLAAVGSERMRRLGRVAGGHGGPWWTDRGSPRKAPPELSSVASDYTS